MARLSSLGDTGVCSPGGEGAEGSRWEKQPMGRSSWDGGVGRRGERSRWRGEGREEAHLVLPLLGLDRALHGGRLRG